MAWFYEEQGSILADQVLNELKEAGGTVPAIWPLEVVNVLIVGERRKRHSQTSSREFIENLEALPIAIDAKTHERAWETIFFLASRHQLSAYDAAYLELGIRTRGRLATLDIAMRKAAMSIGLDLFDDRTS